MTERARGMGWVKEKAHALKKRAGKKKAAGNYKNWKVSGGEKRGRTGRCKKERAGGDSCRCGPWWGSSQKIPAERGVGAHYRS